MTQLDLFDWTPPPEIIMAPDAMGAPLGGATIICFPQDRNIGKARHVAAHLLKREGRLCQSYWNQVCTKAAGSLAKAGVGGDEINRQLAAFSRAVSREMSLIESADHQQPGGAA